MAHKGRVTYVPPSVFEELEQIRQEDKLDRNADAFNEMVKYCQVGREAKKIFRFRW